MMSRRIARLCLVLALIGGATLVAVTWNGNAQTFDRRDRAAVVRALQAATGRNFIADNLCIATPEHFPDIVMIESMVPDAGCLLEGWFVRGRWQHRETGLLETLAKEQLAARGWASADADTRRTLALQWIAEVTGAGRVVTDPDRVAPHLQGQGIAPPATETRPDGGVIVRVWVIRMTIAGTNAARVTYMFGPDGTPGR